MRVRGGVRVRVRVKVRVRRVRVKVRVRRVRVRVRVRLRVRVRVSKPKPNTVGAERRALAAGGNSADARASRAAIRTSISWVGF